MNRPPSALQAHVYPPSPPGINAQARKLQKSRSRVTSTLMERALGRGHSLWRSLSELDLSDQTPASAPQSHTQGHGPEKELEENHQEGQVWNQDENLGKNPQEESVPEPCRKEGMERAPAEVEKRGAREGEGWEREETESSDDSVTQYFIHPPHDCPYLLLLRGYSLTQVSATHTHTVSHTHTHTHTHIHTYIHTYKLRVFKAGQCSEQDAGLWCV